RLQKLDLLRVDAEIRDRLAPSVSYGIEAGIAQVFSNHFEGLTQRGGSITASYDCFETVVEECLRLIARIYLGTASTIQESELMLSHNVPRMLAGFVSRRLESSAPEIPQTEREMFQRAMALWIQRMDPSFQAESATER